MPFHRKINYNKRYFGGTLLLAKDEIRKGIKILENFEGDKTWIKLKQGRMGTSQSCGVFIWDI